MWGMSRLKYYITLLTTAHQSTLAATGENMNIDTRLFPTRWTPWQSFQPTVCCSDLHWKASWRQLKVPRLSTMASKWPWIALNEFGDIRLRRWDPFLLFEVKPPSQGLRNRQLEGKVRTETILPARARHFRPIQRHQPLFVGLPSWHVDYKRRVFWVDPCPKGEVPPPRHWFHVLLSLSGQKNQSGWIRGEEN